VQRRVESTARARNEKKSALMDAPDRRGTPDGRAAAAWLDIPVQDVDVAIRYYAEYTDEIDEWIRIDDEEAARAEEALNRRQELLG
jgi:hypothetical protein